MSESPFASRFYPARLACDALRLVGSFQAVATADRGRAALRTLEDVEWVLREARANVAELADDLKGFYEPEKGWPPQIDKADEVLAEIDDLLGEGAS